jgi:hypothetical protein
MKELNNNKSPLTNSLKFNLFECLTKNTISPIIVKTKVKKKNTERIRKYKQDSFVKGPKYLFIKSDIIIYIVVKKLLEIIKFLFVKLI